MRLTKKAAALLVAAAMVMSMGTTVFAASSASATDSSTDQAVTGLNRTTTASTELEYNVTASYAWSVPAKIEFNNDKSSTGNTLEIEAAAESGNTQKVMVTKNVIPNGKSLKISVGRESDDHTTDTNNTSKFAIKANNHYLNYVIKKGTNYADEITFGGEVLTVASGNNTADQALKFVLTKDSVERAGEYKGTATFIAQLVDTQNSGN